jgi:hypothetical protein
MPRPALTAPPACIARFPTVSHKSSCTPDSLCTYAQHFTRPTPARDRTAHHVTHISATRYMGFAGASCNQHNAGGRALTLTRWLGLGWRLRYCGSAIVTWTRLEIEPWEGARRFLASTARRLDVLGVMREGRTAELKRMGIYRLTCRMGSSVARRYWFFWWLGRGAQMDGYICG